MDKAPLVFCLKGQCHQNLMVCYFLEKRIRQAILLDETDHIALTIWENLLNQDLEEISMWYSFSDVIIKDYKVYKIIKLSTTTSTEVTQLDKQHALVLDDVDVQVIKSK